MILFRELLNFLLSQTVELLKPELINKMYLKTD